MAHELRFPQPVDNVQKMLAHLKVIQDRLSLPEAVDCYFLLLRLLTIVGGLIWFAVVPYDLSQRAILGWLLVFYIGYSCLLYAGVFRWPTAIRILYQAALLVDLIFVSALVHFVGMVAGSFFIAFYLLVAVHSFYFGLGVGLRAASVSSLLYAWIYFEHGGIAMLPWFDFVLRITFLFLIAFSMGLLAAREKQMRQIVEELNQDLSRKNNILEQAYRHLSIGKLIGEIAEGINSPCAVMATRSEILIEEAKERDLPVEFIRGLQVINRSSHQVAQVVKSLLTFSKQNSFDMKPLDLNGLVEDTLVLMESEFKDKGVKVEKRLVAGLPPILADAYELKGVLVHLISNGIDATRNGGTIGVTTGIGPTNGREIVCSVSDDGIGIPAENLEKIFNPFFTTKHNEEGIGLGLSTSLSVMKKHNGSITVKSKPGKGATFFLSLPAHRSSEG
jgi:signal transduction histidine kinase